MFVYLTKGIWRDLRTNKQYPTPVWYEVLTHKESILHTNTSDERIVILVLFKIAKFYCQGLAKHFH